MTTPHLAASVRHVVQAATLAPSVHNTQPWSFDLRGDGFDLHADASRRLEVLDPTGRQLHVSCGAALHTASVAARALGLDARVELLPEPGHPSLLARLTLTAGSPPDDAELALALAVLRRHTVREAFDERPLPDTLLRELRLRAEEQGAALRPLHGEDELVLLSVLLSDASSVEEADPAYRAETTAWLHDPATGDGIPAAALQSGAVRGSSLRTRDFGLSSPERSTGERPPAERPEVVVLTTSGDDRSDWLVAGQALAAVLLRAAADGVQAQPLGQVVDLPGPRWALARGLSLTGTVQAVLRLGFADATATTPRRDLDDVLV